MSAVTTIKVSSDTKATLRSLGEKGMSYDEIIQEVISAYLAHVEELCGRLKEFPRGRPLEEIMDELEGRA